MAAVMLEVPEELRELAEAFAKTLRKLPPDSLRAYLEDVENALEDAEDEHLAMHALRRIESGEDRTYTHEEVWRELNAVSDQG